MALHRMGLELGDQVPAGIEHPSHDSPEVLARRPGDVFVVVTPGLTEDHDTEALRPLGQEAPQLVRHAEEPTDDLGRQRMREGLDEIDGGRRPWT